MQSIIGWVLLIIPGILLGGQMISTLNFTLAQRLGLQESNKHTDSLWRRAEIYTARWDLISLACLPLAGILMITDHAWWPLLSLCGGAIFIDTGGREFAKAESLRAEGILTGTSGEQRLHTATCAGMSIIGLIAVVYSSVHLIHHLH